LLLDSLLQEMMAEPEPSSTETAGMPENDSEDIASLSEMFPLLSKTDIRQALGQCGGKLSSALDLLLTRDLVDREMDQQGMLVKKLIPICDLWVRGECTGARATACRARHFYVESDCQGKVKARKASQLNCFSSPYKVRLVTEQIKIQREKVNVESGNIEKWLECEERQVIDLTGCENEGDMDVDHLGSKEEFKTGDNEVDVYDASSKGEVKSEIIGEKVDHPFPCADTPAVINSSLTNPSCVSKQVQSVKDLSKRPSFNLHDSLLQENLYVEKRSMGHCCETESDNGPDPEERRRLQAEAAEKRLKENEVRGLKDPEGAKHRIDQKGVVGDSDECKSVLSNSNAGGCGSEQIG